MSPHIISPNTEAANLDCLIQIEQEELPRVQLNTCSQFGSASATPLA